MFSAVQRLVRLGLAPRAALVLMLDLKKAYDSLDRKHLEHALLWHGLPPDFVALAGRLHEGTTASFQANGYLSDPVDMRNGIRQGCSLAPIIFVLALDLLFRRNKADLRCPGIKIHHIDEELVVAISGYADDIALLLRGPEDEEVHLSILAEFGSASGLSLKITKRTAVCLHPEGFLPRYALMRTPPTPLKQSTRYLGVPVLSAPGVNETWATVIRAIQVQTVFALHKTADVLQCCKLAVAIIVPKILYVARHVWPTTDLVEGLNRAMHNFVWTVIFYHELSHRRKALLNRRHSQLKTEKGSASEPNVQTELRAMVAATVAIWANSRAHETQIIGDVVVHGGERGSTKRILGVLSSFSQLQHHEAWIEGRWHCDLSAFGAGFRLLQGTQLQTRGKIDLGCLFFARAVGSGVLHRSDGGELRQSDVMLIARKHVILADNLEWRWIAPGRISFSCVSLDCPPGLQTSSETCARF